MYLNLQGTRNGYKRNLTGRITYSFTTHLTIGNMMRGFACLGYKWGFVTLDGMIDEAANKAFED